MNGLVQLNVSMNPFLFGTLILLFIWIVTWALLKIEMVKKNLREFWWASFACSWLGATEPFFVPEYWTPPTILRVWRWDLESFLFCFAIGGIAAVVTELPSVSRVLKWIDRWVFRAGRPNEIRLYVLPEQGKEREQVRTENMLLVTVFIATFGATSQLALNIIYDASIVCAVTAMFVTWRRPRLRWQVLGGALSFLVIYTFILVVTGLAYPDFYEHWNIADLSTVWVLGAPFEVYLFAFSFGLLWAPLYEAWKHEPVPIPDI